MTQATPPTTSTSSADHTPTYTELASAHRILQDDFATLSLPGRLKTPAGRQEPFTVTLLDAA